MPTFCRHSRLVQNCAICAREQDVELRPVVSPAGRPEPRPRPAREPGSNAAKPARATTSRPSARSRSGSMTVRRLARAAEDGYESPLVPGLRAIADAERLAAELSFAATRLQLLAAGDEQIGLYAEVADPAGDLDERIWLAVQIAVLGPLDPAGEGNGSHDPFATVRTRRTSWASMEIPALDDAALGPRAAAQPARALAAYRAWVGRQSSPSTALVGDPSWTPERRFDRVFERLSTVSGMDRGPRYDLLVTLGRLEVHPLQGTRLHVGPTDPVTLAAKRILGIGDPLLLERRAGELAAACSLPVEALDLGFANWERGRRSNGGLPAATEVDSDVLELARSALGLD